MQILKKNNALIVLNVFCKKNNIIQILKTDDIFINYNCLYIFILIYLIITEQATFYYMYYRLLTGIYLYADKN